MNLKVTKVIDETWDSKTIVMEDQEEGGRPWDYWAGQYLTFRFDDIAEKPIVRSYTMSSSPCQLTHCAVTVKRVEGGFISNWMCDKIGVGTVLRARGPIGRFIYEPQKDQKHLVMVAAGSGVTPFVSIMREYAFRLGSPEAPESMTLVVSFRSRADLLMWKDLQKISAFPKIQILTTLSRDPEAPTEFSQGRMSDLLISKGVDGRYQEATFMSCGPQAIMDLTRTHALSHGVPEDRVKTESFES